MTFWRDREPFWDEPPTDSKLERVITYLEELTEEEQRQELRDYGVDDVSLDEEEVEEQLIDILYQKWEDY